MMYLTRFTFLLFVSSSLNLFSQTNLSTVNSSENINLVKLPPILLSFDAILNGSKVELTWSSNTEQNHNLFVIEKTKDSKVFEEVLTIKNFGNYSNLINYFDLDLSPYKGVSYYRLSQKDTNGLVLSSRLVSIDNKFEIGIASASKMMYVENSPVLLPNDGSKEAVIVLRNESGVEKYSRVIVNLDKNIISPADVDNKLHNGTYLIVASSYNAIFNKKIEVGEF